jgi:hypothetical protein
MAKGKKTGGRTAGTPNKITSAFKTAVLTVYDELGGNTALLAWAQGNPTEFFKICARLIPHEVIGPGDGGAHLIKQIVDEHRP